MTFLEGIPSEHNEPAVLKYERQKICARLECQMRGECAYRCPYGAAPDLLAALQSLHDDIAEYASINNLGGFDNHVMRMARAAIAKAVGDVAKATGAA